MKGKTYTFFIASSPGKLRKVIVPAYVLHAIAVLALIGAISVTARARTKVPKGSPIRSRAS